MINLGKSIVICLLASSLVNCTNTVTNKEAAVIVTEPPYSSQTETLSLSDSLATVLVGDGWQFYVPDKWIISNKTDDSFTVLSPPCEDLIDETPQDVVILKTANSPECATLDSLFLSLLEQTADDLRKRGLDEFTFSRTIGYVNGETALILVVENDTLFGFYAIMKRNGKAYFLFGEINKKDAKKDAKKTLENILYRFMFI